MASIVREHRAGSSPPGSRSGSPPGSRSGSPPGSPIERLHRYLERLSVSEFYGKVVVSFHNGKVHDIKVEETKKLEEL
jgi:hypothetical protein